MDLRWTPTSYIEDGHFGYDGDTTSLGLGAPSQSSVKQAALIMREAANKRLTEEAECNGDLMQYGNTRGDPKYRVELAKFLTRQYGSYPVDKNELICTAGATQGLHAIGSLLFQQGDVAFIEDPTYFVAKKVLKNDCKLQLVSVSRDNLGINTDVLEKRMIEYKDKGTTQLTEKRPFRSMIYLVPTFHNPTGQCMSAERCQKVVELAREHDSLIVCDDVYNCVNWITKPDGSFANPPPRLKSYDNKNHIDYKGHVLSNGSFTKFMGPGLRLGWWEAPIRLHDILRESGYLDSGGGFNHFTGGILGTAMELGLIDKHVHNVRTAYQEKVSVVCRVLREKMPYGVKFEEPKGGYFIWIKLPEDIDVPELQRMCNDVHNVSFLAGENCSPTGNFKNYIRISFSYYSKEEIVEAVIKISATIAEMLQQSKTIKNNLFLSKNQGTIL